MLDNRALMILKDSLSYGYGCIAVALVVSLGGCELGRLQDSISNAPFYSNSTISMPSAEASNNYSGGANRLVVVPAFIDKRLDQNRIGMKKLKGEYTANILTAQDVNEWLGLRLSNELKAAGFRLEANSESTRATTIQGFMQKVFIEPVVQAWTVDFETDVSVLIHVARPDGLVAERRYFVKSRHPYSPELTFSLAHAMEPYNASSLRQAMDMLMRRVVADVIKLLDQFPETEYKP